MIKANELRIGNLIWWCHEEDESVKVVDIDILDDFVYHDENPHDSEDRFARFGFRYAPIPLTEEWLIKLGFVKNHYSTEGVQYNEPFFHINLESKGWRLGYNEDFGWTIHPVVSDYNVIPIKYVHQLQNLYYALTSTELTPKD